MGGRMLVHAERVSRSLPSNTAVCGDCYSPDLSARKLTADILVGKMHRCMVVRIEGEEDNIKEAEVGYGKDGH